MEKVAAVILAAGQSRRFGSPKALVQFGGKSALSRLIDVAREAGCAPIVVVVGIDHAVRVEAERCGVRVVINPDVDRGQTSSLQAGLKSLLAENVGVAFFLVDQPLVRTETVRLLISRFGTEKGKAVRPIHAGRGGHPTMFPPSLVQAFLDLAPDKTARDVLFHDDRLVDVPVDDRGVIADFDTRDAYEKLRDWWDNKEAK